MTREEAEDLIDDEMLDAAQAACDVYRVDAMKIIAAALAVLFTRDEDDGK